MFAVPVILAGGLNAGNVKQAIETVRPFGVDANSGNWSYWDSEGEIRLSENSDVFAGMRVNSDWSSALLSGSTVMGQGWLWRTTQGDVNVLFSMEASS